MNLGVLKQLILLLTSNVPNLFSFAQPYKALQHSIPAKHLKANGRQSNRDGILISPFVLPCYKRVYILVVCVCVCVYKIHSGEGTAL